MIVYRAPFVKFKQDSLKTQTNCVLPTEELVILADAAHHTQSRTVGVAVEQYTQLQFQGSFNFGVL